MFSDSNEAEYMMISPFGQMDIQKVKSPVFSANGNNHKNTNGKSG
jgi:hypothetical protein